MNSKISHNKHRWRYNNNFGEYLTIHLHLEFFYKGCYFGQPIFLMCFHITACGKVAVQQKLLTIYFRFVLFVRLRCRSDKPIRINDLI